MDESENYIKVHDFLRDDLHLTDMMIRVFAFIFTMETRGLHPTGQSFIARKCNISQRETKHIMKCLSGIGIIKKISALPNGTTTYGAAVENCSTTTEAKKQLVRAMHRCTAFTGAHDSPDRCMRCTFGGAHHAPILLIDKINNDKKQSYGIKTKRNHTSEMVIESGEGFDGQDTL